MTFDSRLTPSGLFSYHTASENQNFAYDLGFWKKASCFGFSLLRTIENMKMCRHLGQCCIGKFAFPGLIGLLIESTLVILCQLVIGHRYEIVSISILRKLEAVAAK